MRNYLYIFFALILFLSSAVHAQDTLRVVKDLSAHISLHHKDGKEVSEEENEAHLYKLSFHDSLLLKGDFYIDLPQHTFLAVNGQIVKKITRDGWRQISVNEIMNATEGGDVKMMFYHETPFKLTQAVIGTPAVYAPPPELIEREKYNTRQHIVAISFLLILALLAVLKKQRLTFIQAYFDVRKLLTLTRLDDHIIFNAFSPKSLFIALIAVLSLTFTLVVNDIHIQSIHRLLPDDATGFVAFGLYIIVLYPLIILKFFFLRFLSGLMNLRDIYRIHFFEFVRYWLLVSIFFMFLTIFLSTIFSAGSVMLLTVLSFIVLLVWLIRLSVMLRRQVKFKNVYFFSYLCISEILPLIILFKQIEHFV